ncbi:MAG: tyrosine-type recombinase/integrase [Planctomycetota bacterium]|nr:tyrosine-type recombinase/integrase [Planctomycetota bacterium]
MNCGGSSQGLKDDQSSLPEVQSWLDYLLVERGLAANTLAAYRRDLVALATAVRLQGVQFPHQVQIQQLREYLQGLMAAGASASSQRRRISAIRGFFRFLVLENQLDENPADPLVFPRQPQRLPRTLSIEEVNRLIEATAVDNPVMALRDRAIAQLLYSSGMRVSELCGLRWRDFKTEGKYPLVRCHGKGGKVRLIPIGDRAKAAVQDYRAHLEADAPALVDHLFVSTTGRQIHRRSVYALLARAAQIAGITQGVNPHLLRHSFATHILENNTTLRELKIREGSDSVPADALPHLQHLLGHASIHTTEIYTHVDREQLKSVHSRHHPRP